VHLIEAMNKEYNYKFGSQETIKTLGIIKEELKGIITVIPKIKSREKERNEETPNYFFLCRDILCQALWVKLDLSSHFYQKIREQLLRDK
jgi:hypothetical protein